MTLGSGSNATGIWLFWNSNDFKISLVWFWLSKFYKYISTECVLETDVEEGSSINAETKPKRKRGRKKKEPKKVQVIKRKPYRRVKKAAAVAPEEDERVEEEEDGEGDPDDPDTSDGKRKKKYVWKPATQEVASSHYWQLIENWFFSVRTKFTILKFQGWAKS